jgi:hypothetical protein
MLAPQRAQGNNPPNCMHTIVVARAVLEEGGRTLAALSTGLLKGLLRSQPSQVRSKFRPEQSPRDLGLIPVDHTFRNSKPK